LHPTRSLPGLLFFRSAVLALLAVAAQAATLWLDGNDHISRKKIESALTLPDRPSALSAEDWEDWVDDAALSISDLYGEMGYLDAAVKVERAGADSAAVRPQDDGIRIRIREGERYRFGTVTVEAPAGTPRVIDPNRLQSRPGRPFEKELVFRDRSKLLNAYGDRGFLHARSTEQLIPDTSAKAVNLHFEMDPGPAVVFDTLILRNRREDDSTGKAGITSSRLLRNLLGLHRGDTASLAAISSYERKLKASRSFNYARVHDSLLPGGGSALILSSEERVPGEADGSVFLETQYGAGVAVNWGHGNMLGNLHEGKLGGSIAQRKQSVYLGYASPLFFGTLLRFDDDLVANWYQDSHLQRGVGLYKGDFDITNSSKLSRVFSSWSRGLSNTELAGESQREDSDHVNRSFNLNFINTAFFTFLDAPANPSQGARWALTWGNGGSFVVGGRIDVPLSNRHNWLEIESAYFLPASEHVKLALRLDGGRFFGAGEQNSERFFLGGPRSVRSYGWRQICPEKDSNGVCQTSGVEPAYYLGSFEIRANPFTPAFINPDGRWAWLYGLQVVPFADYGEVWEVGKKVTETGKGRAFGLGLRYSLLSIFNFRIDYAADSWERTHSQWILDLAQAF
jgi:outer membrane protein assembly factor BamA